MYQSKLARSSDPSPELHRELDCFCWYRGREKSRSAARSGAVAGARDSPDLSGRSARGGSKRQAAQSHQILLGFLSAQVQRNRPTRGHPRWPKLAAHRLLSHGVSGTGKGDDKQLGDELFALWQNGPGCRLKVSSFWRRCWATARLLGDEACANRVDIERGCPPVLYTKRSARSLASSMCSPLPGDSPLTDPQRPCHGQRSGSG